MKIILCVISIFYFSTVAYAGEFFMPLVKCDAIDTDIPRSVHFLVNPEVLWSDTEGDKLDGTYPNSGVAFGYDLDDIEESSSAITDFDYTFSNNILKEAKSMVVTEVPEGKKQTITITAIFTQSNENPNKYSMLLKTETNFDNQTEIETQNFKCTKLEG